MGDMIVNIAVQPGIKAYLWGFLLVAVLPVLVTVGVLLSVKMLPLGPIVGIALTSLVLFGLIALLMTRNEIIFDDDTLRIRAGFYSHSVSRTAIDWQQSRIVDFKRQSDLKPGLRVNGIGLPGYQAGWFKLANGSRAFVLLTQGQTVYLALKQGEGLLLSVDRDFALLSELSVQD